MTKQRESKSRQARGRKPQTDDNARAKTQKIAEQPRENAAQNKNSGAVKRTEQADSKAAATSPKKKSDIKLIYKTTDGYFTGRKDINKTRNVAVLEQREDDGALAVVKIYSKKDKKGSSYISRLVLKPKKHSALTEKSIVGTRVIIGVQEKTENGITYKPIFKGDLIPTDDALTEREHKKVIRGAGGKKRKHKATLTEKIAKWRNHFK